MDYRSSKIRQQMVIKINKSKICMKYVFRFSILSFFGQTQQLTINQLSQALAKAKFPKEKYPIQDLINMSRGCIQTLLKSSQKQTNHIISKSFDVGVFSDLDVTDLPAIWHNEKHALYKEIIRRSTASAKNFDQLGVSINSKIASKSEQKGQSASVNFKLTSVDERKTPIRSQFQMNPKEAKDFLESLKEAESLLDQIFE